MVFIFFMVIGSYALSIDDTVLVLSPSTPKGLSDELSDFSKRVTIVSKDFEAVLSSINAYDYKILIDATMQPNLYNLLDTVAFELNTIYLSLSPTSSNSYSVYRFNLHNLASEESNAISKLIGYLSWNNFILIGSSNQSNLNVGNSLYKKFNGGSQTFSLQGYVKYEDSISQTVSDDIVKKMIKSKGINQILIVDSGNSFIKIQSSLQNLNLATVGYVMISSSMSIYSAHIDGLLIVVESGLENAVSLYNYHRLAILKALSDINGYINTYNILNIQSSTIVQILKALYPSHITTSSYSVVNFYNNTKVTIGTIEKNINIRDIIHYPGNTTTPTISVSTPITISIANGTNEIYNSSTFTAFAYYSEGARYAVETSNLNNEIPGFYVELTPTDCGNFLYDEYWYTSCYSKLLSRLGVAYMTGFVYKTAYGSYITLEQLNKTIPQISAYSQASLVDNKTTMPYFLKLSETDSTFFNTFDFFTRSLGWNSVVVLGTDDEYYNQQYLNVIKFAEFNGFTVSNPVDKRIFPWNYTRNDFEKYKSYFQAAKDTRCRLYVVTTYDRGAILEGLYDIGLRSGDIILMTDPTVMQYLIGEEYQYLLKRKELLLGALIVSYKEYNGNLGLKIKKELSAIYNDTSNMCYFYDTFSTIKEAINYMLSRGTDYENPVLLSNAMRTNKFVGCLGTVYFDSASNSRCNSIFGIQQVINNQTTQSFYLIDIADVNLFSSPIINMVGNLQWPLGGDVPSTFRDYSPCPFDSYEVIESSKGKVVLYCISAFFLCVSVLGAVVSYRLFRDDMKELKEETMISFSDMVFLSYFLFQFLQFIAMGPDQTPFQYIVPDIQYLASIELVLYFDFKFYSYWVLFYSLLGLMCAWVILVTIIVCRFKYSFQNIFIYDWLRILPDLILPFLGHVGLLPVFSLVMHIYLCEQAIGEDLQDSFLQRDCTTFCYQGNHKIYVIISSILTTFYLLSTIFCRPLWEKTQFSLNITTKAEYLSILSVFQVMFVILNKTLKPYDQSIHGYVLSFLILLLLGITIYIEPYNYKRVNIIQCTSLFLSCWGILSAAVFRNNFSLQAWIGVEFIGFIFIFTVGIIVMAKFPALLYSNKGKDVSILFIFQFCKRYENIIRQLEMPNTSEAIVSSNMQADKYRID
jgi:Receptor family ligand binding region